MVTACEVTVAPTSVGASDSLAVGSLGGLSDNGGYQSATKKLSLSGTASVADYQAALRSVSFSNPSSTAAGYAIMACNFEYAASPSFMAIVAPAARSMPF